MVRSPAHTFENDRNPREDRRLATASWLNGASVEVALTEGATSRARELKELVSPPFGLVSRALCDKLLADACERWLRANT